MSAPFPLPPDEDQRIAALARYHILDSAAEPLFDDITQLASDICDTPISVLTLVDAKRQWFKSARGLPVTETPREIAFCTHTILQRELFEVTNATLDPRFAKNPLVTSEPHIRFYAGVPLVTPEGHAIGSLAVIDSVPRKLTPRQTEALNLLAKHAMLQLEFRRRGWETNERFGVLVHSAPVPIVVFDKNGLVTLWNPAAERVFGWAEDEVLHKNDPSVPEDEEPDLWNVLRTALQGKICEPRIVYRRRKDGTRIEVRFSMAPVRSALGEVNAAVSIAENVTEVTRSARELQQTVSLLRTTLEATADGILVVDRQGKIRAYNQQFLELWNIPPRAIEESEDGTALQYGLKQLRDPKGFLERVVELYQRPELESFDVLEFADGRVIERYSKPQVSDGDFVGRVWSFRDVTTRVRLENDLRQMQKLEAVGSLAGGIAHDFNNLLSIVIGYTALLQAELPPDSALNRHAASVRDAAERASALTRQLLAFSRKQVLRPEVLDLNSLISNLCRLVRRIIPENIDVQLKLAPGSLMAKIDPGQMEQVIVNLVVNSRDAMPHGGTIVIGTSAYEHPGSLERGLVPGKYAEVSVSDTGTGIDPADMPRIFEPFFTTKEVGKGTGLGLSTVYGIVRQSGGDISVRSEPGQGTVFTIHLPLVFERAAPSSPPGAKSAGGRETILLVEDDRGLRMLVREILRIRGYTVLEADSPQHALQIASEHDGPIHLLLTDVVMPDMHGGELAERVRTIRNGIKILFMSGYADQDLDYHYPPSQLIEKPFPPDQLALRVREALDRRAA